MITRRLNGSSNDCAKHSPEAGPYRYAIFDRDSTFREEVVTFLGREFIAYYPEDRTHLGLDKDTPLERLIEGKPERAELESMARVGGLHHRYVWKAAA